MKRNPLPAILALTIIPVLCACSTQLPYTVQTEHVELAQITEPDIAPAFAPDVDPALPEPSLLYALRSTVDSTAGTHFSYEVWHNHASTVDTYDVHCKDGVYYSACTTRAAGEESAQIIFLQDDTVYSLSPEKHIAMLITESSPLRDVLRFNDLYDAIYALADSNEYTRTTEELDGVIYTVETHTDVYGWNEAFYFDENNQLAYYRKNDGESMFTIDAIDNAVNDALLDISGYEIKR